MNWSIDFIYWISCNHVVLNSTEREKKKRKRIINIMQYAVDLLSSHVQQIEIHKTSREAQ